MNDEIGEAERAGQVNRFEISGWLTEDVQAKTTSKGTKMLKSRLAAKKPGPGNELMRFGVTVWCNDMSQEKIEAMQAFKAGDAVVIVGKYDQWIPASGAIYPQIIAYKIEHGIE